MDPALILREILKLKNEGEKAEHYIVFYYGKSQLTKSGIFSLAKLRAIENRIGIIVLSKDIKLVLKTTKYKNIQLFQERKGIFGLNKECLDGPMSIFTHRPIDGIPVKVKEKYLELL